MATYRLAEHHPAMKALNELWQKADELGINICVISECAIVTINGKDFKLQDIENSDYPMTEFPPSCEFKLTYEKEE